MDMIAAATLERDLTDALGLTDQEVQAADAMVKEMMRLRTLNPTAYQGAILLVMSTMLATGDKTVKTNPEVIAAKLERMVVLQKRVAELVQKANDEMVNEIMRHIGLSEEDEKALPKEKLN